LQPEQPLEYYYLQGGAWGNGAVIVYMYRSGKEGYGNSVVMGIIIHIQYLGPLILFCFHSLQCLGGSSEHGEVVIGHMRSLEAPFSFVRNKVSAKVVLTG
jgi:hypothetical protein